MKEIKKITHDNYKNLPPEVGRYEGSWGIDNHISELNSQLRLAEICRFLKDKKVSFLEMSYSGSGDDGSFDEMFINMKEPLPKELDGFKCDWRNKDENTNLWYFISKWDSELKKSINLPILDVETPFEEERYNGTLGKREIVNLNLIEALEDCCYDLLPSGCFNSCDDYDGSNGTIILNVNTGHVEHNHYERYIKEEGNISEYNLLKSPLIDWITKVNENQKKINEWSS
tara:strand:- start:5357 stop:6043 length:687 start_codon:yes stop_codon:yes gene_type:complete